MADFEGVLPILNTTFHDDGSLDLESQRRLVRFVLDAGAHGLALFGNAGEGYTLLESERRVLLRTILEEVDRRVPVIVSTGHTGTDAAVALSREAEEAGAAGVMVLPPHLMKPDAAGICRYYRAISDAIGIPIMIQDAPLMTQVTMGASLIVRAARECRQVRYVKIEAPPTAAKVTETVALAGDGLIVFGGLNGQFFIEELGRGSRGTMPGCDMVDVFVRVWDLCRAGRRPEARAAFNAILPLIRYELQPGLGVSCMKHNLHAGGVIASPRVRHPTRELDDPGRSELEELRSGLDLLALRWSGRADVA